MPGSSEAETLDVKIPAGAVERRPRPLQGQRRRWARRRRARTICSSPRRSTMHPMYRRDGADVLMTVPVTVDEAVLGAAIVVPAPDGTKVRLTGPAGSQEGTVAYA